jgi:hypothetical protein
VTLTKLDPIDYTYKINVRLTWIFLKFFKTVSMLCIRRLDFIRKYLSIL